MKPCVLVWLVCDYVRDPLKVCAHEVFKALTEALTGNEGQISCAVRTAEPIRGNGTGKECLAVGERF